MKVKKYDCFDLMKDVFKLSEKVRKRDLNKIKTKLNKLKVPVTRKEIMKDYDLTPTQLKAIDLLINSFLSKKEISAKLKITPKTLSKWLSLRDFREKLEIERELVLTQLKSKSFKQVSKLVETSINNIKEIVTSDNPKHQKLKIDLSKYIVDRFKIFESTLYVNDDDLIDYLQEKIDERERKNISIYDNLLNLY